MSLVPPAPQAIVIFGASGDLTRRKILPALYELARASELPERYAVVGYARTEWDDSAFREHARGAVEEFGRTPIDEEVWKPFADSLHFLSGPFDDAECLAPLNDLLARIDAERGTEGGRLYYCATPPSAFPLIVGRLGECGPQANARIVIEKPFGHDLESARELNRIVHDVFDEKQVFRIDHYLGKETVQNILVFRFFNAAFERLWNRDAIDHVQITVSESVGIGGRGGYYEEAGAVRDMIQSHLLQVLTFLAMEPPRSLDSDAIRDEKVKVLRALCVFDPGDVVRGQYAAGAIDSQPVGGYHEEEGVPSDSRTETFVAIRARIDNWRWAGVPFFLRTGKRLPRRATEVVVVFREPPAYLAEGLGIAPPVADHLTLRLQPEEGITFAFQAKEPGSSLIPKLVNMDFSYGGSFETASAEAYERLIHDAMSGDGTLFPREDGVQRAWELVAPLLEGSAAPHLYPVGTWGPSEADDLIAPRKWHLR